jgi:hypothetical protein
MQRMQEADHDSGTHGRCLKLDGIRIAHQVRLSGVRSEIRDESGSGWQEDPVQRLWCGGSGTGE